MFFFIRDDDSVSYVLIGIVGGNLAGCSDIREYPDYFTYVGHTEVTIAMTSKDKYYIE